ncbi:hypothetical protein OUZ56_004940 [Daphnia magna]|uniref:Uncharacterized protein n=1 Tax=Daphnia magna TaxID=35525 RepID=A0ABQ9YRA9_9CRUS|nr:hypothetical protein OUZ56_004940 [Daphnia magna]
MYLQVCFFLFVEEEGVTCRKREKVALKTHRLQTWSSESRQRRMEVEEVADRLDGEVHGAITHFNRIIHQDLKRAAHIIPLLHRYIIVDVFMMTKRSDSHDKSRNAL